MFLRVNTTKKLLGVIITKNLKMFVRECVGKVHTLSLGHVFYS